MATKTAKTPKDDVEKPAAEATAKAPAKGKATKAVKAAEPAKAEPAKAEPAKAEPAKEAVAKADAKTSTKGPNSALKKPLTPSHDLAEIVGAKPLARTEVVSKVWDYIRKHDLQNPKDKREILADDKLKAVFGKDKATMFEMNKLLSSHLV